jgi:hypothetical protein
LGSTTQIANVALPKVAMHFTVANLYARLRDRHKKSRLLNVLIGQKSNSAKALVTSTLTKSLARRVYEHSTKARQAWSKALTTYIFAAVTGITNIHRTSWKLHLLVVMGFVGG